MVTVGWLQKTNTPQSNCSIHLSYAVYAYDPQLSIESLSENEPADVTKMNQQIVNSAKTLLLLP